MAVKLLDTVYHRWVSYMYTSMRHNLHYIGLYFPVLGKMIEDVLCICTIDVHLCHSCTVIF